jgi:hypothetical protein
MHFKVENSSPGAGDQKILASSFVQENYLELLLAGNPRMRAHAEMVGGLSRTEIPCLSPKAVAHSKQLWTHHDTSVSDLAGLYPKKNKTSSQTAPRHL